MTKRRLLRRTALSPKYDLVQDTLVETALRGTGHAELLDPTKFERCFSQANSRRGAQGAFGYQMAGVGVEHPKIYFAEVHEFRDLSTGKHACAVISFQVNEQTGEVIESTADVKIVEGNQFNACRQIGPGQTYRRDGDEVNVIFLSESLDEALSKGAAAVNKFKKSIEEVGRL